MSPLTLDTAAESGDLTLEERERPTAMLAWRGVRNVEPRIGGSSARTVSFVIMRVTGLALAVLVLGHFTLTHIVNDVADTDSAFVAQRWNSALWVAWDWLMLATAVIHGASGVWIAIDDYTPEQTRRRLPQSILIGVSALALMLGTVTIAVGVA
jgi:succinate dehydrogenase hydrophobic anchor subunit